MQPGINPIKKEIKNINTQQEKTETLKLFYTVLHKRKQDLAYLHLLNGMHCLLLSLSNDLERIRLKIIGLLYVNVESDANPYFKSEVGDRFMPFKTLQKTDWWFCPQKLRPRHSILILDCVHPVSTCSRTEMHVM